MGMVDHVAVNWRGVLNITGGVRDEFPNRLYMRCWCISDFLHLVSRGFFATNRELCFGSTARGSSFRYYRRYLCPVEGRIFYGYRRNWPLMQYRCFFLYICSMRKRSRRSSGLWDQLYSYGTMLYFSLSFLHLCIFFSPPNPFSISFFPFLLPLFLLPG